VKEQTDRIKKKALDLGFSKVGIARASSLAKEGDHLREWLDRGYHGTMSWMARDTPKRADPRAVVPGARSVISLAFNYYTPHQHTRASGVGKISRYAWGDDYHEILHKKLRTFWHWLEKEFPGIEGRYYVDTGPLMEKAWAQQGGIGWIGKHTNVIAQELGSWVFLSEVISTLELEYDTPATDHCGSCVLCIEACPTGAINQPYVLDATLCISYLTIEHKGEFADPLGDQLDRWIFGCDICQDVCPWNQKFSSASEEQGFAPRPWNVAPRLEKWAEMTEVEFEEKFRGSPLKRTKHSGLQRNVKAALDGERRVERRKETR